MRFVNLENPTGGSGAEASTDSSSRKAERRQQLISWLTALLMPRDVDGEFSSYPETPSCPSAVTQGSNGAGARARVPREAQDLTCGDSKAGSPQPA